MLYEVITEKEMIGILLDQVPAAIALCDREFRYVSCNRRWLDNYVADESNFIGRSHFRNNFV